MVEEPAQRVRHGLCFVVVVHARQIAPAAVSAQLDEAGPELDSKREPAEQDEGEDGRRNPVVAEEDRQEARLQEQRLPAEGVPTLADVDDAEVQDPEQEPHEHGERGGSRLGEAQDDRRRENDADPADADGQAIGVAPVEQARRIAEVHVAQVLRHRQQPVRSEQRPELVHDREEREQVDRPEQPLEDLARQPVAGSREPVCGHGRRRVGRFGRASSGALR